MCFQGCGVDEFMDPALFRIDSSESAGRRVGCGEVGGVHLPEHPSLKATPAPWCHAGNVFPPRLKPSSVAGCQPVNLPHRLPSNGKLFTMRRGIIQSRRNFLPISRRGRWAGGARWPKMFLGKELARADVRGKAHLYVLTNRTDQI